MLQKTAEELHEEIMDIFYYSNRNRRRDIEEGNSRESTLKEVEVLVPEEFDDYLKVVVYGAEKYSPLNWLEPNGKKSSFKDMHDSMFHHLAESFANVRADKETKLDPLLHLATRALMMYVRLKRNIKHDND